MTVNRTHLSLTLYSDGEGGEVLDSFTLLAKPQQEGGGGDLQVQKIMK